MYIVPDSSHKNQALWIKFSTVNRKSILYNLFQKILMQQSTNCSSCHRNQGTQLVTRSVATVCPQLQQSSNSKLQNVIKQQTLSRFSLRSVYMKCSKWCPFISMHARSRFLHSLMASSMMAWLKCDHTSTRRCFSSSTSSLHFWYTQSWRQPQTL